jgi:SAM-dependent methyltransferase
VPLFEDVADEYEAARPSYPDEVFDRLGPLDGRLVVEGGAGTGIATRSLQERGATVVALDHGPRMLARAVAEVPSTIAVVADAARMPMRSGCADVVCFAQSWHWLDPDRRCDEVARVLVEGGIWAAWWSHAAADGEAWFDRQWDLLEAHTVGHRTHRDVDWGADVHASGCFRTVGHERVGWTRVLPVERWVQEHASYSYIAVLGPDDRHRLLAGVEAVARRAFDDGAMTVPYRTDLWWAQR